MILNKMKKWVTSNGQRAKDGKRACACLGIEKYFYMGIFSVYPPAKKMSS